MSRIHQVFLCAVIIVMMITAGCTLPNNSGAQPLITVTQTPVATPVPTAPAAAGTTPPGAAGTQAPGTCAADTSSDAANCGGCGYACPANALCQQGLCYCKDGYVAESNGCVVAPAATNTDNGCPAGMSPCSDGYCYELASSATNCGLCGNVCPAGMACSASTCTNVPTETTAAVATTTAAVTTSGTTSTSTLGTLGIGSSKSCFIRGTTNCGGTCVNLTSSTTNCGTCGHVCKSLAPNCCGGTCMNFQTDNANCGSCGHVCKGLTTCHSGSCSIKAVVTGIARPTTIAKYVVDPIFKGPIVIGG